MNKFIIFGNLRHGLVLSWMNIEYCIIFYWSGGCQVEKKPLYSISPRFMRISLSEVQKIWIEIRITEILGLVSDKLDENFLFSLLWKKPRHSSFSISSCLYLSKDLRERSLFSLPFYKSLEFFTDEFFQEKSPNFSFGVLREKSIHPD